MINLLTFKKLLAGIAVLTIASSPTILVVSTVNSKETKEVPKKEEPKRDSNAELVVKAINRTNYNLAVLVNTSASGVRSTFCSQFMKKELPENIKRIFNNNLYITTRVLNENGVEISDRDFQRRGTFHFKINYNYGEFKNQITNLTIKIVCKNL